MNNYSLKEYLNTSVNSTNRQGSINESLILGSIVCAACVAYAAGPILNTDFMKSVGGGIGALLGGIGSMFGLGGKIGGKNVDDIKELLKKDPDDLTGKEKELLKKAAKNPKLKKEFSNNDLNKLSKIVGDSSEEKSENMSDSDSKELHALLKKKPEDLTPKEKKRLQTMTDKYDLSNELSDNELKNLKKAGINIGGNNDEGNNDEGTTETQEPPMEAMLALAAKANENEKDPKKKAENDSLIDIISTSCYDKDGNPIPKEEREAKLKETVGEENWESFSKAMANMQKNIDNDALKSELEKAQKELKPEDAQKMLETQKERAKKAHERIANEKAEQKKIDDEIADLQKQIKEKSKDSVMKDEGNPEIDELKKKIKEAQDKKAELVNKSALGTAVPDIAKAINDRDKDKNGVDVTAKDETGKDETGKDETGKDETGKDETGKDETGKDKTGKDETKKKLDDAENKWKKKEADFEKEWEKKLDDAKGEEEAEKVMADYEKAKKKLKAEKHKELDAIDDSDEHDTEKDETKQGKYKVKEEEVTDPETGKKIKVKTYKGPRGGKFYYPDGKPKTPENKVYVNESVDITHMKYRKLKKYLLESFNK